MREVIERRRSYRDITVLMSSYVLESVSEVRLGNNFSNHSNQRLVFNSPRECLNLSFCICVFINWTCDTVRERQQQRSHPNCTGQQYHNWIKQCVVKRANGAEKNPEGTDRPTERSTSPMFSRTSRRRSVSLAGNNNGAE